MDTDKPQSPDQPERPGRSRTQVMLDAMPGSDYREEKRLRLFARVLIEEQHAFRQRLKAQRAAPKAEPK